MTRYVVANWKSHKTRDEAATWLEIFARRYRGDAEVEVIVAPSFVFLDQLHQALRDLDLRGVSLAVQDLSPFPPGSYTGAVAAEMVRDVAGYAILGHPERRRYFHETHQEVANKVSEAAAVGIKPILFVDRSYARSRINALREEDMRELIIGYGPVEAIGIHVPQSPELVGQAIREIREMAPGRPVLYGGSVDAANAATYVKLPGVSGVMVGTASLDPEEFARICEIVGRN